MATNIFANITAQGTKAIFTNAMNNAPSVWDKHSQTITSDGPSEQHVWMGMVPEPRLFVSGRSFVGLRDFTLTLVNNEYEMSFIIDQNSLEDDKHGLLPKRVAEAGNLWATFHDSVFGTLMIQGENDNAFDGTSFHNATRTIGNSGAIDNTGTANIGDPNAPSLGELQIAFKEMMQQMHRYADDTGRTAYNTLAMTKLRMIIPPELEARAVEMIASELISSGSSNPFYKNKAEIDVLPYLTDADNAVYLSAVGDPNRMPVVYQERTPLQVEVFNSSADVADNHGLKFLARQRFVFGYGEPRRSFRYDFT